LLAPPGWRGGPAVRRRRRLGRPGAPPPRPRPTRSGSSDLPRRLRGSPQLPSRVVPRPAPHFRGRRGGRRGAPRCPSRSILCVKRGGQPPRSLRHPPPRCRGRALCRGTLVCGGCGRSPRRRRRPMTPTSRRCILRGARLRPSQRRSRSPRLWPPCVGSCWTCGTPSARMRWRPTRDCCGRGRGARHAVHRARTRCPPPLFHEPECGSGANPDPACGQHGPDLHSVPSWREMLGGNGDHVAQRDLSLPAHVARRACIYAELSLWGRSGMAAFQGHRAAL